MFRAALAVLVLFLTSTAASAAPKLEFLGEEILPTGLQFDGTEVGGLSSIAYDADLDRFYVISDDQSVIDPARYYTFALDVADGNLEPGDIVITDVTTLLDGAGLPFAAASFDPEGLALTKDDQLVITSEGIATRLIPPWVRLFGLDGQQEADLPVPLAFIPDAIPQTRGVRQNLGFESGTTFGPYYLTGSEGALVQDGPAAGLGVPSPARLLRYRRGTVGRSATRLDPHTSAFVFCQQAMPIHSPRFAPDLQSRTAGREGETTTAPIRDSVIAPTVKPLAPTSRRRLAPTCVSL